jgi:hypothetical protein
VANADRKTLYNLRIRRARMKLKVLVTPGDGIGPEITAEAIGVLQEVAAAGGHTLELNTSALAAWPSIRMERLCLPTRLPPLSTPKPFF